MSVAFAAETWGRVFAPSAVDSGRAFAKAGDSLGGRRCVPGGLSGETSDLGRPSRCDGSALAARTVAIRSLRSRSLNEALGAILEPDGAGFIARSVDFPLYGYGDDAREAVEDLKCEIEDLYEELSQGGRFTDEWLGYKERLDSLCRV